MVVVGLSATIVASATATTNAASGGYQITPAGWGAIIAGMLVFLALGVLIARASYRRKKEYEARVKEWRVREEAARAKWHRDVDREREEALH